MFRPIPTPVCGVEMQTRKLHSIHLRLPCWLSTDSAFHLFGQYMPLSRRSVRQVCIADRQSDCYWWHIPPCTHPLDCMYEGPVVAPCRCQGALRISRQVLNKCIKFWRNAPHSHFHWPTYYYIWPRKGRSCTILGSAAGNVYDPYGLWFQHTLGYINLQVYKATQWRHVEIVLWAWITIERLKPINWWSNFWTFHKLIAPLTYVLRN